MNIAEDDTPGTSETDKGGDVSVTIKRCYDSGWKGQYCCVPLCCHTFRESARLGSEIFSFHSFPNMSTDKERDQEWIVKIQ